MDDTNHRQWTEGMAYSTVVGYSTRRALTTGIEKVSVYRRNKKDAMYVHIPGGESLVVGKEFFESKAAAECAAKSAACKKVASLKRQLEKVQKLVNHPKWLEEEP